jgi:DNA-binding NarL/FixJ family response regulator
MKPLPLTRVLVVDDDALTRAGLAATLTALPQTRIVGPAATAAEARAACTTRAPDFIVLDLPHPAGPHLGLLRELSRLAPRAGLVALSAHDEPATQQRVFHAGARAFLHRADAPATFADAFAALRRGERYTSPHAAQQILAALARPLASPQHGDAARLTPRELEIFTLLAQGLGPKAMSIQLGCSTKTIETHFQHMKEKLAARTMAELRRRAEAWLRAEGGLR